MIKIIEDKETGEIYAHHGEILELTEDDLNELSLDFSGMEQRMFSYKIDGKWVQNVEGELSYGNYVYMQL